MGQNMGGKKFLMFHDNKLSADFSFSSLIRDISEYFKLLKNMGVQYPDISPESEKIIKNLNIIDVPISKEDKIAGIEHQVNEKLSCLSLHGTGDVCAKLFFIICDKKVSNTESKKNKKDGFAKYHQGGGRCSEIFQGDAGILFEKILKAMNLSRKNVYTSCILIPDSGQNQQKISNEVDLCINLIKKQIDIIHPEVICCLGDTAAHAFLKQNTPISLLRDRFHDYKGIKVMATFDPGLLLSQPEKKRDVWNDMQKIMAVIGNSS